MSHPQDHGRVQSPSPSFWRNRDFRLIWGGQTLSDLGTGMTTLAYPLLMLTLTRSPAQAGAVAAVSSLPYLLFGLAAGALVDRWNRKRVMICCELARAVNVVSLPIAMWWGHLYPAHVYVAGFIGGALFVFFSAADAGALPHVVARDQLTSAVAAQQATSSATAVAAPLLGGTLYQASRSLPFLLDAVSYLLSAVALRMVRSEFQTDGGRARSAPMSALGSEIAAGLRWLWSQPVLRTYTVAAAGLQLAMAGAELVVIVAAQDAGASAAVTGLVLAAVGIGGVAGSVAATRTTKRFGPGRVILGVIWIQAVVWVLIGVASHHLLLIAALLVVFVVTAQVFGVTVLGHQLSATPDHLLSRVGTAFRMITWSSFPAGAAITGAMLTWVTVPATCLILGAWVGGLALLTTLQGDLL
ncbi:MFS transporter [Luteipulveratus mongoliensis]|uniref:Major facilitator superfamily (MFS) profile domain-containing protein n=1 Tax=Luteipulveratus mongoliensis TaxID=571913 RepID=A0A0K1JK59_9MICO|nr:MFS transporter [Luteipulveratus mongoliensis]AKU16960.1 hypothetical protein VV02_15660 [Luteipulveratus mongoliensis]